MSDEAEIADALMQGRIAASLARIDASIPAGVAGVCDDCGETMPRLVGGRCGFCRDGRRPPLSRFDDLPVVVPATQEKRTMADTHAVTVPATGPVLQAIRERAQFKDMPLGRASFSLIEDALTAREREGVPLALDQIHTDALLEEIGRRVNAGVPQQLLDAAIARAESVEGQLAVIRGVLDHVRPQD